MSLDFTPTFTEENGIPRCSIPKWKTFQNTTQVTSYFGYLFSSQHLQEGTLIFGGGYNSTERINGPALSSDLVDRYGISNSDLIKKMEEAFEIQYPIFAGKLGGKDLNALLDVSFTSYKLCKILSVLVEFVLDGPHGSISFQQPYLVGSILNNPGRSVMTLIQDRGPLYQGFEDAFGYEYPRHSLYPLIRQTAEDAKQWRALRGLPPL